MYTITRRVKALAPSAARLLRHPGPRINWRPSRGLVAAGVAGLLGWQLIVAGPALAKAGNLDLSFGTGGKVMTSFGVTDQAQALAVQADGKLVAAGSTFTGTSTDFALARYNPDGTLDPGFGAGGKVTTSFGGTDEAANAIAVQADGKLVAAGWACASANWPCNDFALARYNPDGTLDSGFGTGGEVTTNFAGQFYSGDDRANALVVQSDGKLVAAGTTDIPGEGTYFALARYNPDGTLDTGFGTGGTVITMIAGIAQAYALALQPDGKLAAAGWAAGTGTGSYDFALARYNPDGTLDTGFGTGGTVTTDFGGGQVDEAHALVVQGTKLVAAGTGQRSLDSGPDFALARYNPDGTLDSSFGTAGTVTTNMGVGTNLDQINGLVVQGTKIVAAGSAFTGTSWDFALARYRTSGALDNSFGTGGKVTTDFAANSDDATAVAVQADGKLVAAGSANDGYYPHFALARYNP
jgi:uncharacterized delta-60 repeat protein